MTFDLIAVLGGNYNDPDIQSRVEAAVSLYNFRRTPILFSGGNEVNHLTEAEGMREYARRLPNAPRPEDMDIDNRAKTTIGNIFFLKQYLQENYYKSPAIVTSSYHVGNVIPLSKLVLSDFSPIFFASPSRIGDGILFKKIGIEMARIPFSLAMLSVEIRNLEKQLYS